MSARLLVGDVFDRMAEIPDGSVDLIVTSPPFLRLRSYLDTGHPDKGREIGSEATPAEFLDTLLELTAQWRRVLAPHGSIAVELGDTYAGSGGPGGDYNPGGLRDGQQKWDRPGKVHPSNGAPYANTFKGGGPGGTGWPLEKSLTGIPTLYAWSLAYGRNLLTGAESPAGQWRIRNLVAWVRPNPPVGALADKYRPATSYVTVATLARDRWFDLDAVRTPLSAKTLTVADGTPPSAKNNGAPSGHHRQDRLNNLAGAPPLDWWEITPGGYSGAHYAVFPPELPKRLIDSMCPRKVCTTCGEPSRRIVEVEPSPLSPQDRVQRTAEDAGRAALRPNGKTHMGIQRQASTVGWSTCGHNTWRPGLVLDPFAGSGTTLAVASGTGRDSIGIDLDERNADLALERVGMFLDITPAQTPTPTPHPDAESRSTGNTAGPHTTNRAGAPT